MKIGRFLAAVSRHRRLAAVAVLLVMGAGFAALLAWLGPASATLITVAGAALAALSQRAWRTLEDQLVRREARRCTPSLGSDTEAFTRWRQIPVDAKTRSSVEQARQSRLPERDLVIGRFDDDGRLFGPFGELPGIGFEPIPESSFRPRRSISVDLVLEGDLVLVRKDFRGDRQRFRHERCAFARLLGHVDVPPLRQIDEARTRIYKGLILGRKVRDILIDHGARLRDADLEGDPELDGLDARARAELVCRRSYPYVRKGLPGELLRQIEEQLDLVHARGITHFGFTPGNIILDTESKPWFFDFDGACIHRFARGPWFAFRRHQDRRKFDRHFGTELAGPSRRQLTD